jgi:bla regulator protein blaR1
MRALTACMLLGCVVIVSGQATNPAPPTFEAASVKPNRSATSMSIGIQGGRVRFIGITARQLLVRAYGVQPFEIVGGPDWLATDRFDVIAKAPENATVAEINLMLRALLAERFKLVARVEKRESPVFFLVIGRDDGRLGPAIKPAADTDCGGPPTTGDARSNQSPASDRCRMLIGVGVLEATAQPLRTLAAALTNIVGRSVVDTTDLAGRYDFKLTFTPETRLGALGGPEAQPQSVPDAPSIFTALQEQLGLKLERQRGPVDVVVIDGIQQPSAD